MDMTHEMRFDLHGGGGSGAGANDLQRIDAMRRTFTARRFGSGYDAIQVNRLFDAIIASLSGRSNMPLNESELDPNQFVRKVDVNNNNGGGGFSAPTTSPTLPAGSNTNSSEPSYSSY